MRRFFDCNLGLSLTNVAVLVTNFGLFCGGSCTRMGEAARGIGEAYRSEW